MHRRFTRLAGVAVTAGLLTVGLGVQPVAAARVALQSDGATLTSSGCGRVTATAVTGRVSSDTYAQMALSYDTGLAGWVQVGSSMNVYSTDHRTFTNAYSGLLGNTYEVAVHLFQPTRSGGLRDLGSALTNTLGISGCDPLP
jgi:hypothetical protein